MGRLADPIEVKKKRGTLRLDRTPDGPLTVVEPPPLPEMMPSTLGATGTRMWNFIADNCADWIAPSDVATVQLLCEAMDRRSDLISIVDNTGILLSGKHQDYINPALKQLTDLEAQITKWMAQLGLNPSDRGRLGLTQVKAKSKLEEMRDRAQQRKNLRATS